MARHLKAWHPDPPDHRDISYRDVVSYSYLRSTFRPKAVHLAVTSAGLFPPVYDQGELGSCVFNGGCRALAFTEAREGHTPEQLSRLALYYNFRMDNGEPIAVDDGATVRGMLKTLRKHGAPLETLCPYDVTKWTSPPSKEAEDEGRHRRIGLVYMRLEDQADRLDCLASGWPIVFGMVLFQQFEGISAQSDFVTMPGNNESPIGGHCLVLDGYDKDTRMFDGTNSWGLGWGNQGRFRVPFDYVDAVGTDFWTVRKVAK